MIYGIFAAACIFTAVIACFIAVLAILHGGDE